MSHWFMVRYDPAPEDMPYADDALFVVSRQAWLNDYNEDNEHYVYAVTTITMRPSRSSTHTMLMGITMR